MKDTKKEYKELLFDLFAEGFDLVFGSSSEKQWYAGLLSDCEEDIDGLLSYLHTEDKKCKILSEEETALIHKRVYHNFIRIRDELGIPRADRLYRDDLILVRNDHNEPWKHACFAKFHKTGVKVYSNGTNSYTSPDNKKEFYQYYKSTRLESRKTNDRNHY